MVFIFVLSQGTAQISTKHYKNGEISFDYPENWQELKAQNSQIAVFKDPETGSNITINRQMIPEGHNVDKSIPESVYKPNENYVITPPEGVQNDFKPVSSESGSISGVNFAVNTYKTKINGSSLTVKELWLQKNNALYSVIYKTKQEKDKNILFGNPDGFDVIKNSLKVDNASLKKSYVFASISIPKLGVKWDVRSDTLNAYNAVLHYGESFYPGQNGSCGIIGHHTFYSAPFNHIETLKKGDKVYIDDYLTQKRYVYSVLNASDIRYDYKTNKITFNQGSRELIIGTCWPPGRSTAEIYAHCQLDSVEPL